MTDKEFNAYKWAQERKATPERFKTFMPQSREGRERDRRIEEYERNKPDANEYNGPF